MFIKSFLIPIVLINVAFVTAQNCTLKQGLAGQCRDAGNCAREREFDEDDTPCGSGKWPDVCCEVRAEDLIDNPYGRIARRECQKQMDSLFEWQSFGHILGGTNARDKEFTFMAALGYGSSNTTQWSCGGSLISSKHILTAAHCLQSLENGPVSKIRLGDLDLAVDTDVADPQDFTVLKAIPHPDFKYPSAYHDIAILELDRPVKYTDYVKPACLDVGQVKFTNETQFVVTGWGYIDTADTRSTHLQEVELGYSDFDKCKEAFPAHRKRLTSGLQSSQLCAAGVTKLKDTCLGDSGGPLARVNKSIRFEQYKGYVIVGITSFGKPCGVTEAPGVYTKVYSYVPWIESIVWPEQYQ